jgi:predicted phage terminase large subunit-like protein
MADSPPNDHTVYMNKWRLTYAQSWDMAFDKTETSSFVVGQVWYKLGANRYLVDQVRDRMDFNETVEAVQDLSKKWPQARLKLVEKKANGAAVINALHAKISGLVAINPRGSKVARLSAISPSFKSGNVYLPLKEHHPWVEDWIEEVVNVPNAPNDDQADR